MKKVSIFVILLVSATAFAWSPYGKISTGLGIIDDGSFQANTLVMIVNDQVEINVSDQVEYENSMVLSACVGVEHQYGIFIEGVLAHQSVDGNYKSDVSNKVESAYTQCGLQVGVEMFEASAIQPYMMFGLGYLFSSFEDSVGESEDTLFYGSFSVGVTKEIASKYEMYVQFSKLSSELLTDTYQSIYGHDINIETELEVSQFTLGVSAKF